jgi:preprotein translocase subunit SecB
VSDQQEAQRQFMVQRIYTKDISFEAPNSPTIFQANWKPEISVNLNTETRAANNDMYELALKVTVEAKHEGKTVFLVEVTQAGLFLVQGFSDEEVEAVLGIGAANVVFPYAREAVTDLVSRGSFPQFVLQPVNFEALFAQQKQAQAARQAEDQSETAH